MLRFRRSAYVAFIAAFLSLLGTLTHSSVTCAGAGDINSEDGTTFVIDYDARTCSSFANNSRPTALPQNGVRLYFYRNSNTLQFSYYQQSINGAVNNSGIQVNATRNNYMGSSLIDELNDITAEWYSADVNDPATYGPYTTNNDFVATTAFGKITFSVIAEKTSPQSINIDYGAGITGVTSTATNGTFSAGDTFDINVTFERPVTVTGAPQLRLETGAVDGVATYVSGSGTSVLHFTYEVQATDSTADLDYASSTALELNGGTIKDSDTLNAALVLPAPGATGSLGYNKAFVLSNGTSPTITSVTVPSAGRYWLGQNLTFTVNLSENVIVTGTPRIALTVGTSTVYATYRSGSGSAALVFQYTVQTGADDPTDIGVGVASTIENSGSIFDWENNAAVRTLNNVGATSSVIVQDSVEVHAYADLDQNVLSGATVTLNGTDSTGSNLTYLWTQTLGPTVTLSSATAAMPTFTAPAWVDGNAELNFSLVVGHGQYTDPIADTVRIYVEKPKSTTAPTATIVVADNQLNDGDTSLVTVTFSESLDNAPEIESFTVPYGDLSNFSSTDINKKIWTSTLDISWPGLDSTNVITLLMDEILDVNYNRGSGIAESNNYAVNTALPVASILVADNVLSIGETSAVTFTFTQAVTDFTNADLTIPSGALTDVVSADNITWTATFTPAAATSDTQNVIALNLANVTNAGSGTVNSNNYAVDTVRPTATISVNQSTLTKEQEGNVSITFDEPVMGFSYDDMTVANGTLYGLGSLGFDGKRWTAILTPNRNAVDPTNLISLNMANLTDRAGNVGVGTVSTANYAIDTVAPTVTSVDAPNNATYGTGQNLDFTVNWSKNATVDTTNGTPRIALDVGGTTIYANYVSGSGSTALVFRAVVP
ncbi:MAG: hypothetical protein RIR04_2291, partial [Pseudomonadota bacterium]